MTATLCFDIGGTHVKAAIVAEDESFLTDRVKADTPRPAGPDALMDGLVQLADGLGPFDRIAAGFPGVVRHGVIRTAPNLGTDAFRGFDLATALESRLGKPARVGNDADVQGMGAITGTGVEVVVTLGTGFGTAIFEDGRLGPHLELAHHPFRKKKTYEELLGDAALEERGEKKWRKSLRRAIEQLRTLTEFDHLYIGGGNARLVDADDLPDDVSVVSNLEGIAGGIWLWQERHPCP